MTSDTSKLLKVWVHKQLAKQSFYQLGLMLLDHFQEVACRQVYEALHEVPMMFQNWACKQVTNIAGVNSNQAVYKANHDPMCPSFNEEEETCRHVLGCDEEGRVKSLNCTIDLLDNWMRTLEKMVCYGIALLHMPGSVGGFQWSTLCGIKDRDSTSLDSRWTR